uniref:Uncharacterized protein n=1 Tax=viral metagenome TaxID=1070528 RepID=A0A6C0F2D0_9ZZZZ
MARHRQRKSRGRGRRGGAAPWDAAPYPGSNSAGQWNTSVGGNQVAAAANNFKSFLGGFADKSGGAGANPALAREMVAGYATKGQGQGGGGSRRHKRQHKGSLRRGSRKMSQAQAQAQSQSQSGGMFASFGALIKEALVPLGLLAMQQGYGKSYGKKHTRKHRR